MRRQAFLASLLGVPLLALLAGSEEAEARPRATRVCATKGHKPGPMPGGGTWEIGDRQVRICSRCHVLILPPS